MSSPEALNEQVTTGSWAGWNERSERLIEAAGVICKLWTGEQVKHRGKFYTVEAKLCDSPASPIPLLMAENGPKAMRRAGQFAEGSITHPKTRKQFKQEFEGGAKAAGTDPAQMPVLVEQFVVVGVRKEAERAANLWRFLPKAFKTYYNIPDPKTIQQRAEGEIPRETVYGDWPVSTDPDVHLRTLMNCSTGTPPL